MCNSGTNANMAQIYYFQFKFSTFSEFKRGLQQDNKMTQTDKDFIFKFKKKQQQIYEIRNKLKHNKYNVITLSQHLLFTTTQLL